MVPDFCGRYVYIIRPCNGILVENISYSVIRKAALNSPPHDPNRRFSRVGDLLQQKNVILALP